MHTDKQRDLLSCVSNTVVVIIVGMTSISYIRYAKPHQECGAWADVGDGLIRRDWELRHGVDGSTVTPAGLISPQRAAADEWAGYRQVTCRADLKKTCTDCSWPGTAIRLWYRVHWQECVQFLKIWSDGVVLAHCFHISTRESWITCV